MSDFLCFNILMCALRQRQYETAVSHEDDVLRLDWTGNESLREKAEDIIVFAKSRTGKAHTEEQPQPQPLLRLRAAGKGDGSNKRLPRGSALIMRPQLQRVRSESRLSFIKPMSPRRLTRGQSISKFELWTETKPKIRLSQSLSPRLRLLVKPRRKRRNSLATSRCEKAAQKREAGEELKVKAALRHAGTAEILQIYSAGSKPTSGDEKGQGGNRRKEIYKEFTRSAKEIVDSSGGEESDEHGWGPYRNYAPRGGKRPRIKEAAMEKTKLLIKRGATEADIINEFSPRRMIHVLEERKSFNERTEEFCTLLFDYQQRNLVLSLFQETALDLDLIEDLPATRNYMESLGRAVNFFIRDGTVPDYPAYRANLEYSVGLHVMRGFSEHENLSAGFLKLANARILLMLSVTSLVRDRFVIAGSDATTMPRAKACPDKVVGIVRNEVIKKVPPIYGDTAM